MQSHPSRRSAVSCAVLAAAAYLLLTLLVLRPVLPAPSRLLPFPAAHHTQGPALVRLDHADQSMVVATTTRNAARLATAPWSLREGGQCEPMPRSYTLGEHMFGFGLLAAPAHALGAEPILAYNVALWATLWIPAFTMYALAAAVTGSPPAAFVAGLAFALQPGRIADPTHPYVHGDLWTPLALLFLYRLLRGGGLRAALGLGACVALEVGESLYALLATLTYLATSVLSVALRAPARLLRATPWLLVAAAPAVLAAWLVLGPYLDTRATWGVLSGRSSTFASLALFAPGGDNFPGWIVVALALVALADRMRGRRGGDDLRLPVLAGALLLVWCAIGQIRVPALGIALPSPLQAARGVVPGLDAVRALQAVALGIGLATSLLAGYGLAALAARLDRRRVLWLTVALCVAMVGVRSYGPLARATFGRTLRLEAWDARPREGDVALLRDLAPGAIVDVPLPYREGHIAFAAGEALLRAAYGPRDSAACYNSFASPVQKQVFLLSEGLPARADAAALAALGFGTVLTRAGEATERMAGGVAAATLRERARTDSLAAFDLPAPGAVVEDVGVLAGGAAASDAAAGLAPPPLLTSSAAATTRVAFPFRNPGAVTFRHPQPLAPSDLLIRWEALDAESPTTTGVARALLPIALGAGGELPVDVDVATPARPGRYRAGLARASAPDLVLATRVVEVAAASPSDVPSHGTTDVLRPAPQAGVLRVAPGRRLLPFAVENPGPADYHHLDARGVLPLRITWRAPDGRVVQEEERMVRVPPLIPAGTAATVDVSSRAPAAGAYRVELRTSGGAPRVLGALDVQVEGALPG